jgi:hypothetical protein
MPDIKNYTWEDWGLWLVAIALVLTIAIITEDIINY